MCQCMLVHYYIDFYCYLLLLLSLEKNVLLIYYYIHWNVCPEIVKHYTIQVIQINSMTECRSFKKKTNLALSWHKKKVPASLG